MIVRCVIVEDEPLAAERLVDYAKRLVYLEVLATFDNAADALAFERSHPVDLLFLDVTLGGMSGIELLELGTIASHVVLTTAHPEFALTGYQFGVVDYLLKPIAFPRFVQAAERVRALVEAGDRGTRRFAFVKTEGRLERVAFDDLLLIEGMDDYRRIHTRTKRILTPLTFGELEALFPSDVACRVHKSYMVAVGKIDSVERDRVTVAGTIIPVSDTYREKFFSVIERR